MGASKTGWHLHCSSLRAALRDVPRLSGIVPQNEGSPVQSGHNTPGLQVRSRSGHVREATNRCFSFTSVFLSLSFSLSLPLSKNKYNLLKKILPRSRALVTYLVIHFGGKKSVRGQETGQEIGQGCQGRHAGGSEPSVKLAVSHLNTHWGMSSGKTHRTTRPTDCRGQVSSTSFCHWSLYCWHIEHVKGPTSVAQLVGCHCAK